MVYNIIMYYQNLNNFIIKDVLTKEYVDYIYKLVEETPTENQQVVKNLGHTVYHYHGEFDQNFKNHILSKIQPFFTETLLISEMSFSRYSHKSGYVPKLFPHYDGFSESRITFDIQLKSNIDWPLVVEGKEFLLNNNEALVFSGTDQIHWRKNIDLPENVVIDMFFVHLKIKERDFLISNEDKQNREDRCNEYVNSINISRDAIEYGEYDGKNNTRND